MLSKLEIYMEKADAATLRLTEDYRIWTEFLVTAGRVYKYEFLEQAMIFAQRPDAIACAEYDLWKSVCAGMSGGVPRVSAWSAIRAVNHTSGLCSTSRTPAKRKALSTRTYGNTGANMNRLSRPPWNRGLKFQAGTAL